MEVKYKEYLEEGTKKILEIVSSSDIGEDEKHAVVEAFTDELSNNIGDTEKLHDYEPLLYNASSRFLDGKIASALSKTNVSHTDFEQAIKQCRRQRDIFTIIKTRGWSFPKLENPDIDKCEEMLRRLQETTSISSKIREEDRQIEDLIRTAQTDLSVKACDAVIELVSELEENIEFCKSKKISIPPINNKDTKDVRKRITDLRKAAEQKENLHRSIFDVDLRIHNIVSIQDFTLEQCQELVGLCQKQMDQLSESNKNGWPVPTVRYGNPDEIEEKYKHYQEMMAIDRQLSSERDVISSNKQYKNFIAYCEEQKSNIEICNRNGWELPTLSYSNPETLLNTVRKEKNKKDHVRRIKGKIIKVCIIGACILTLVAFGIFKYREGKVRIGNSNSEFVGQDYETVLKSLEESGFTNVQTQKITTGWVKGKSVLGVTVNNTDTYKSGKMFASDERIVVKYSSDDRVDITSALENWQTTNYKTLQSLLMTKGCNNITLASKETNDIANNGLTASISLNNESFTAGDCFIQATAPITIEYYVLTIEIGNKASDFEGNLYTDVVSQLREKGFTNIHLLRANNLVNGWLTKEGSIQSIRIEEQSDFLSTDSFNYEAEIVIVVNTFKNSGCEDITDIAE